MSTSKRFQLSVCVDIGLDDPRQCQHHEKGFSCVLVCVWTQRYRKRNETVHVGFLFLFKLFQPKEHPKASSDKHIWAKAGYLRAQESPYATHPI